MSEINEQILSFLDSESPADSQAEQSHDVETEELDTDESTEEETHDDGHEEYDLEDESTADSDSEDHESNDDSTEDESTEANNIDDREFKISIDGEEVTVNGKELKSGYMRQAAFTKKTQEIATQRKSLDKELTKAVERSEAVKFNASIEMEKLDGALKQLGGWDGLRREATPEQYDQFHTRYIQAKKDHELAEDIVNESNNAMRENNIKVIEEIFKELATVRHGFNRGTINEIVKYLNTRGFTDDKIMSMTSLEDWEIVCDAMEFQNIKNKSVKSVKSEQKKELENKSHKSAPVKKADNKTNKSRQIEKGLQQQKKATGQANSKITQELLMKIL